MGQEYKKKASKSQIKNELSKIPITFTPEEITEGNKWYSRKFRHSTKVDVEYIELQRSLSDVMNKYFKQTREYLGIGTGNGYYFIPEKRLEKYLNMIKSFFDEEPSKCRDYAPKLSKDVLLEKMYALLQEEDQKKEIDKLLSKKESNDEFTIHGLLYDCQYFKEDSNDIDGNITAIKKLLES